MTQSALPAGMSGGGKFASWRRQPVRYVVADIDGTLVGADMEASDEVAAAAHALADNDIPLGVATGRMRAATQPLRDQLRATGPHITFDGAAVDIDGHVIDAWPLAASHARALRALVEHVDDAYLELYTADTYQVSARDVRAAAHWEMLGEPPVDVVTATSDFARYTWLKGTIVVFNGDRGIHDHLVSGIARLGLRAGPSTSPRTPNLAYINVTDPAADKGRALERAAAQLDVPLAAVLAIGDAPNDLPMLERVGTAVAMGQASAAIKAVAHLVVDSIDNDGAAAALRAATASWG